MKLKELSLLSVLAIGLVACGGEQTAEDNTANEENTEVADAKSYAIDTETSSLAWKGQVVGGGYFHTGTINLSEGSLEMNGDVVSGGSFNIDMGTMLATDSNYKYTEENNPQALVGHLQMDDFFDVENNPSATFTINGMNENTITGDLTIRGKTNEESVTDVVISENDGTVTATGKLTFDRQKYDVAYTSTMKDVVISDDIEIEISLSAK